MGVVWLTAPSNDVLPVRRWWRVHTRCNQCDVGYAAVSGILRSLSALVLSETATASMATLCAAARAIIADGYTVAMEVRREPNFDMPVGRAMCFAH